ncbi:hypothetical protein PLANPX_3357 [Lacipirellula parvula]|uniref:Uncharacterized protein n=1 Tax=Lacipirellula parvula TaxID=2650471 RepID=A0A5K7XBL1_9BACT|nr:hypothetical protein PLANPX_3357 [Lacipirellula parvula]
MCHRAPDDQVTKPLDSKPSQQFSQMGRRPQRPTSTSKQTRT